MAASVLVIDDDSDIVRVVTAALEDEGYRVLASLGSAAIEIARELHPDVVLLDLRMPGMDGAEVSQRLRADPATAGIPIIVVSAVQNLAQAAEKLPVDAQLPKPFDLDRLYTLVAQWSDLPQGPPA